MKIDESKYLCEDCEVATVSNQCCRNPQICRSALPLWYPIWYLMIPLWYPIPTKLDIPGKQSQKIWTLSDNVPASLHFFWDCFPLTGKTMSCFPSVFRCLTSFWPYNLSQKQRCPVLVNGQEGPDGFLTDLKRPKPKLPLHPILKTSW